ncbi:MAG: hypothetical protein ACM3PU_01900 [Gemmatimonadota bacterium]
MVMTQAAAGYLSNVLDNSEAPQELAVRLMVDDEGLTAVIDEERPGDTIFHHDGRKVLLLDDHASEALTARTLDLRPTEDGQRLGLK